MFTKQTVNGDQSLSIATGRYGHHDGHPVAESNPNPTAILTLRY